jgi:Fe-S cluster assembly protein SufD
VQDWNEKTISFQIDTTVAGRDAQVQNVAVNIGAERARFESQTRIEGPGADVKMYSLTVAEETQEFDQRTFQTHKAGNAVSDLLYKNALLNKSRTIFSGLIKVAEGAQQTDAYQTNRNLLLDPTAEANSLPGLEILANDVRCSHGATTGNVDEAELFYMMQRGISRRVAMQLMVFGFFEEIIEKVDNDELAENIRQLIHKKFSGKIR